MYERLIQKLINRNVGAIGSTLTPTGGTTGCGIITGSFPYTHDGSTSTLCAFKTDQVYCMSEWYWDTPVNVTKFNIYTLMYYLNSHIAVIYGRVNGNWVTLWGWGEWIPSHGKWDSKVISCNNCTGIKIVQSHGIQHAAPCIVEVTVDYGAEGRATIVQIIRPDTFTPNVEFDIRPRMRNDGGEDIFFVRLTDTDTGSILKETTRSTTMPPGGLWTSPMDITLTQTTDFHARIEFGHIGISGKVVDDTEDFTIPVYVGEGKATIVSIYKPSSFTPNVSFHIKPKIRNDGADDYLFVKLINTDTGKVLKDYTNPWITKSGGTWEHDMIVTLTQTTDFHGRIDAGHIE